MWIPLKELFSIRFVSSKRLYIHHGRRIFPVKHLLYIFIQEAITLRDYENGVIFISP